MISTLPTYCLNRIFEFLEEDKATLHSCLLVSRLWCRISVEILWRNIWNFKWFNLAEIIRTLIICLPKESKDFLINNGITSIPISKPSLIPLPSIFIKITFSNLRILKLTSVVDVDILIKFLVNNGKNLENINLKIDSSDKNSLDLAIAEYCPNFKSLSIINP
ncbi:hypothetical protein RhiirA1_464753 [Rhizophagus irregularis]|uniref:Uncharacterized protein n=1 Tax=Rhizophagus irregularis TaxID=588596 RepID=A0A2I1F2X3_9GLOM|nr:hypothetical protein RhiirA1_464753 [Rhizophagus irregularis]PKY28729.1 hypothetical protein RhiirB3_445047 [Rhizophagus irregularis]